MVQIMTKEGTLISPFFTWRFFSREQEKNECDWVVMSSVFVASQSSCFFLCSREQIRLQWQTGFILVTKTLILFKSAGYHAFGFNKIRPRIQYQSRIISQQWDATYVNHLLQYNYFQFSTYNYFQFTATD